MATKNLGPVTAYAYAREHGYTGTEEEFEALMGGLPSAVTGAQEAVETVTGLTAQATKVSATSPAKATYNKTTNKIEFEIPEGNGITSITLAGTSGNIKTYTINFDDGTTTNFEVSDGEITLEYAEENLAYNNGYYEDLTAGSADQLVSTQTHEDEELYTFRTSGGSVDIGNRETDKLVGGTVAWNQLVQNVGKTTQTINGVTFTVNSDGTITMNGTATALARYDYNARLDYIGGHTYAVLGVPAGASASTYRAVVTTYNYADTIAKFNVDDYFGIRVEVLEGVTVNNVKFSLMCIDLTQMFGSTIADALYEMEQAEAGSGVAWFKKYFPKPYYAYNAGSLQSVNVASHDMVGFNQVNKDEVVDKKYIVTSTGEEDASNPSAHTGFIRVIPRTDYYTNATAVGYFSTVVLYDANKKYIGYVSGATPRVFNTGDAHYIIVNTVKEQMPVEDLVVNLSWSGWRNGEYAGYSKHSYPYDETVELRGIPQLVDGKLVYDGDTYEADGTVNRKYGIVDLGTCNWRQDDRLWFAFELPAVFRSDYNRCLCNRLTAGTYVNAQSNPKESEWYHSGAGYLEVYVPNASSSADVRSAMNGTIMVYPLATPTTEQATGFTNPQVVDDFGTEEYVDAGVKNGTRDVSIPVGHHTEYMQNLRDKLQHLPNLSEEDGDFFIRQKDKQMSLKKVEGEYDDLTAGNAKQLVSTVTVDDATPYTFRTSGGSADIGNRAYIDSIVGGTVAFNQLVQNGNFADVSAWSGETYTVSGNVGTFTCGRYGGLRNGNIPVVSGHKYLAVADMKADVSGSVWLNIVDAGNNAKAITASTSWQTWSFIYTASETRLVYVFLENISDGSMTIDARNVMFIDLTQMFGSTIADYIYSLEQANAGTGVAFFESLFSKPYYAYNAGELMSVRGLVSHDMVGFNVRNPSDYYIGSNSNYNRSVGETLTKGGTVSTVSGQNPITITTGTWVGAWFKSEKLIKGQSYQLTHTLSATTIGNSRSTLYFIDEDDKVVQMIQNGSGYKVSDQIIIPPENGLRLAYNVESTTPQTIVINDLCLHLVWSGTHDGEYEAYRKVSYPLDSDLELRGIPKLDASNNLYYDGDTYESDGAVTRKYGIVDLGTLDWIMDASIFRTAPSDMARPAGYIERKDGFVCSKYPADTQVSISHEQMTDKSVLRGDANIYIKDTAYNSASAFKTAMSGVYLVYELATPTTETADPYTSPQMVHDWGTEEFVIDDTIDVPIPVGHNTRYPANLRDKLQHLPDLADNDGYYMMKQTGAEMSLELFRIPKAPSTNGKYQLTATVSGGTPTYVWEEVTE